MTFPLQPFSIGTLPINPPLILAPMSGVTHSAFRRLIRILNPGCVGLTVTEFISIEGLTRLNPKSVEMMRFKTEERPISIQIFGYDLDRMVDAAKMAEDHGADIVDINSGCPVPKVVKRGGGCELMRQPEHLAKLLSAVRSAVRIPVTLKIRAGWDEKSINAPLVAQMAEDSGVSMLAVHGRTRAMMYRGSCDWDLIAEVADKVNIPVVGSGDVTSLEMLQKAAATGVAGVMIGRGAIENPRIFSELCAGAETVSGEKEKFNDRLSIIKLYEDLLLEEMPPKGAVGKLKQLATRCFHGFTGSALVRKRLCQAQGFSGFQEAYDSLCASGYEGLSLDPIDSESQVSSQVSEAYFV